MPVIELHIVEGYDDKDKTRMGTALTDAIRTVIPASPDAVTILIHEAAHHHYMRGGNHHSGAPALPDPAQVVRDFLNAMEARDLDTARSFLGDGFTMTFPGTAPMTTLEQLIDWAAPRYRFVRKTYEGFDSAGDVTYCRGTLSGEWPDGTAFDSIRFIDRFEVENGKLTRQEVWNDIAEIQAQNVKERT